MSQIELYVSPFGNDSASGSAEAPFCTPQRAIDEVKALRSACPESPVTVTFSAGDYEVKHISFSEEHSGSESAPVTYKAKGDGEVLFNGGTRLLNSCFEKLADESVLSRLAPEARKHVLVCDLKKYGITYEDIGPVYSVGSAARQKQHEGISGNNCEFFWNGTRLSSARYPDNSMKPFLSVVEEGDAKNLVPGVLELDEDMFSRIKKWKEPEKAWMFAYFKYTWADSSTPIAEFDMANNTVKPAHSATYGYGLDKGRYYFFNVLEELDAPGEYYIDREKMLLYVYPPVGEEDKDALISISTEIQISGELSHTTFEGITFAGVRNDVISLAGNCLTFRNCMIMNSYGWAMRINGYHDTVTGCEICSMGRGGVSISGGDRATLTHSENLVENCYIHNFSEVYKTYQQAVFLIGCGATMIHNEIAYAPHLAFSYTGNEHVLAYNYIHDVVRECEDAGALYVGGDWSSTGDEIKYNYFKNIGTDFGDCKAIYFDDGMSNGLVYGNIVDNCSGWALNFGGGFGITVENNLVISTSVPLHYDQRLGRGGWDSRLKLVAAPNGGLWESLRRVPYKSELYRKKYPLLSQLTEAQPDIDDKFFPGNPGNSVVRHNLFIGPCSDESCWNVTEDVYRYSDVSDNYSYRTRDEILCKGTFSTINTPEGFEDLQEHFEKIGRYGHQPKPIDYIHNGYEKVTLPDGSVYEGDWVLNKMQGMGKRVWQDGAEFEGEWSKGHIGRNGRMKFADGRIYEGQWYLDVPCDDGVMTYPDGGRYEGYVEDGQRNRHGVMTYPDGSVYDGEWFRDKPHGKGIYTSPDGTTTEGEWVKGVLRQ